MTVVVETPWGKTGHRGNVCLKDTDSSLTQLHKTTYKAPHGSFFSGSTSTRCSPNSSPTGLLPGFLCRPSLFLFQGLECGFLTFSFGCVLAHRGLSPGVTTLERTSLALMVTGFNVASSTGRDFQPQYLILFA